MTHSTLFWRDGDFSKVLCDYLLVLLISLTVAQSSFATDPPAADQPAAVSVSSEPEKAVAEFFEAKVRPLFAKHCFECHSKETGPENGELVLDSLDAIRAGGSRGPLLTPKNPEASLIYQAVCYTNSDLEMPPDSMLPEAAREVIRRWIELGGATPIYREAPRASGAKIKLEEGRNFWAFRSLELPQVPASQDLSDPVASIDALIQQRLSDSGLKRSKPASREVLIRRATFDLIGLPPTPEEVRAFVADDDAQAYERLIDRLLDSPHYGERWGRVWLDVARYADAGYTFLTELDHAWHYRDWVIDALNRNLPYDQFVKLQLAADLTPDTDIKDYRALGFLAINPTYWKELKLAPSIIEQFVAEEWDGQVDAFARTFLGLTVSCARCHDHKFDPITMEDYYALTGVFASIRADKRPLLPEPQATVVQDAHRQVEALKKEINKLKKESPKENSSDETQKLQEKIDTIKASTSEFDAPWIHVVSEASVHVLPNGPDGTRLEYRDNEPRHLPVFGRGSPAQPIGDALPHRFLSVLCQEAPKPFAGTNSGRLELAEALFDQGRSLSARVMVNRIWTQHFGQGIVRTPSDFGLQGDRPTHPELLEFLAVQFIENRWDIKWLHRQIMLSETYRQASEENEEAFGVDPDNRLLWRMPRRRLDFEMWRDAMLAVSGELQTQPGGPPTPLDDDANLRRTIYGKVNRPDLTSMLRLYDFPDATAHSPQRTETITPLQQLFVLNSPFIQQRAARLAANISNDTTVSERIRRCYQLLFSRDPAPDEARLAENFLASAEGQEPSSTDDRWLSYVHVLLGSNEFMFVD